MHANNLQQLDRLKTLTQDSETVTVADKNQQRTLNFRSTLLYT